MENLLRTDFERRILRKMVNRHPYYNKNMSRSRQLSQKNRHCEGKCIFQNMHLHWECFKMQLSVAMSVYILSGKEANQLQVIYIRTLGNIQANFSTQGAILKSIPNFFLEVLGQLKSLLWKIMSSHIIHPIRITVRFCKLPSLVFLCVFCVLYRSKS